MNPSQAQEIDSIARDIAAIGRIGAVPAILRVVCQSTSMGFAAIARVTETDWTACAVHDNIGYGIKVGKQLDIRTTLCNEARLSRYPVVFDHASQHPIYRDHQTPKIYGLESYISVPIVRKDGSYFGNLCAIDPEPRKVADERTVGMFQLFAELIASQLESEDREEANKSALRDAEARAELREQFIAVLGHDLRNPLWSVIAGAEALERGVTGADTMKIGKRIKTSGLRMAALIDDVLDFARGQLGSGLEVAIEPTKDLGISLREVIQELRDANPLKEIREVIDIRGVASCDRRKIQQLLSNLLGNAITHGAAGAPILVEANLAAGWLTLSVHNEGVPIPPESVARVFEPYWRAAESPAHGGLGLGLYICAQIVKAHGGTLSVTSSVGSGTSFEARLPAG